MTVYVLEGPDFAGKTTLAERLRLQLQHLDSIDARRIRMIHNGTDVGLSGAELFTQYVRQVTQVDTDEHVIIDRLHIGEEIYGPIYRGGSRLTWQQVRAIDDLLGQVEAVKIFVDAADPDLLNRFRGERGDDLVKDEHTLIAIANEYRTKLGRQHGERAHGFIDGWVHWTSRHSVAAGFRR